LKLRQPQRVMMVGALALAPGWCIGPQTRVENDITQARATEASTSLQNLTTLERATGRRRRKSTCCYPGAKSRAPRRSKDERYKERARL